MSFIWPDKDISKVASFLLEGYSAGQIAPYFGKSRNAIIGIVMRNKGLREIGFARSPGLDKQRYVHAVKKRAPAGKAAKEPKAQREPKDVILFPKAPRVVHVSAPLGESPTVGRPMAALSPFQCLYAVNDAEPGTTHLFCGERAEWGRFCASHRALVYKPETRRSAA